MLTVQGVKKKPNKQKDISNETLVIPTAPTNDLLVKSICSLYSYAYLRKSEGCEQTTLH